MSQGRRALSAVLGGGAHVPPKFLGSQQHGAASSRAAPKRSFLPSVRIRETIVLEAEPPSPPRNRQPPSSSSSAAVLAKGAKVCYQKRDEQALCTVVAVHYDDKEPYYTVRFANGDQRETTREHLRERQDQGGSGGGPAPSAASTSAASAASAAAASSSEDVLCTGERSREERDRQLRRAAVVLDEPEAQPSPRKRARREAAAAGPSPSSAATASSSAAAASPAAGAAAPSPGAAADGALSQLASAAAAQAGLGAIAGLAPLVATLHASVERAALQWCAANDVDDTRQIVAAGEATIDAFVAATGVKAGGVKDKILRDRLAALRH